MKKIVVGNWKMNPITLLDAKKIIRKTKATASKLKETSVVMAPPFPYMNLVKPGSNVHLCAQDVYSEESGSYTGEVSAPMIFDLAAEYVIVGHSERRAMGEKDEEISKKALSCLNSGLTPIVCIGEKVRDEGGSHYDFIKEQMKASLSAIPGNKSKSIVIAYEPVWAIGAKEAMKPEDIYEMSLFIKKVFADIFGADLGLKATVLYGGAVNYENAASIMEIGKVDGLLVGRESINVDGFPLLLKAVDGAKI